MNKARATLRKFLASEAGATSIEYALIGVGVSIAIAPALVAIAPKITAMFDEVLGAF